MQPYAVHRPSPHAARLSLAIHTAAYVLVNAVLAAINVSTGGDLWSQWPLLGWGVGVAYHAWVVSRHVGLRWKPGTNASFNQKP